MEALVSSYGESSSSSDSESSIPSRTTNNSSVPDEQQSNRLPPPPIDLLNPPNSIDCLKGNASRVRSFPHVEGNYAVHVSIPDPQVDGRSNGNLLWTEGMDRVLLSTLQKQLSLGNKSKYGWKSIAYSAVIHNMWRKQRMKIKKDHIRSRLKTWRKINAAVKEMLGIDGFRWDEKSKTVKASEHVWREALTTRKHLRQYKGKSLAFYPEIAQLVGDDQPKGTSGTIQVMTTKDKTVTNEMQDDKTIANEMQDDPLGADIHLGGLSPRDADTQIPLPTHVSSSSSPYCADSKSRKRRNRTLTAGLLEELSGMRFEVGRVASALESKSRMDDPLWDQCSEAIEAMTDLDDEAKLMAMEIFVDGVEKRKMFIRLKNSQRQLWILSKIGRTKA